jgi:hypothetical protein
VHDERLWTHENFTIEPAEPFQATIAVPIPSTAMHSFHSAHNSVQWKLMVRGEVEHWPTFARGFPIVIYPGEATLRVELSAIVARMALRPQAPAVAGTGAPA